MLQLKYDKMDVVEEADHRVRLDLNCKKKWMFFLGGESFFDVKQKSLANDLAGP